MSWKEYARIMWPRRIGSLNILPGWWNLHIEERYPLSQEVGSVQSSIKFACVFSQTMNKLDFKRRRWLHLSAKHLPQRRLQLLCWDWSLKLNQNHEHHENIWKPCLLQSTWINVNHYESAAECETSFLSWTNTYPTAKRRLKSLALLAAVTARMALMVFRMQNTLEVLQHWAPNAWRQLEDIWRDQMQPELRWIEYFSSNALQTNHGSSHSPSLHQEQDLESWPWDCFDL